MVKIYDIWLQCLYLSQIVKSEIRFSLCEYHTLLSVSQHAQGYITVTSHTMVKLFFRRETYSISTVNVTGLQNQFTRENIDEF